MVSLEHNLTPLNRYVTTMYATATQGLKECENLRTKENSKFAPQKDP